MVAVAFPIAVDFMARFSSDSFGVAFLVISVDGAWSKGIRSAWT